MNQSYDLIFLGVSKSATNSLFELLSNHPEIAQSYEKEYYNSINIDFYNLENFNITSKTKILLDGSVNTFSARNQDNIRRIKCNKLKCIYVIRNPIDRIISAFNIRIKEFKENNNIFPILFEDGELLYHKTLIYYLIYLSDINNLFSAELLFDDLFICKLNDIENSQKQIYDFLGIDNYKFKLKKINVTNSKDDKVIDFVNSHRDLINTICIQSLKSIKEIYKIDMDDLIKEVKEMEI